MSLLLYMEGILLFVQKHFVHTTSPSGCTYRIKPEELYIHSCGKGEAEGRGLFHSSEGFN